MKNLTGKSIGHLAVKELTPKIKGVRRRLWICDCSCGTQCEIGASKLTSGKVASCGCKGDLSLSGFRLVEAMKRNKQRLCKSLPKDDDALRYFLEPSGKDINRFAANNVINSGQVQPLGDGLFSDTSQTWVPA